MKITKLANIETSVDGFNRLLPRKNVESILNHPKNKFITVNTDRTYWENSEDTLVIAFTKEFKITNGDMVDFGMAINKLNPDEYDYLTTAGFIVLRLWWD